MDVGCWVGVVTSWLMLVCSCVGIDWVGVVGHGSRRLEVREGREWMGVCSWSNAVGVVSHDSGSPLDGKNPMLILWCFFWSFLLYSLNVGQLWSQEA